MTAALWNTLYPVGTKVHAYPGTLTDDPLHTVTRSPAWTLGHGEPVVLVEGATGGITLDHIHPTDRNGPIPTRVQRRRDKGWRAPAGARYVGRGSKWGNPYKVVEKSGGWHVEHDMGGGIGTFLDVGEARRLAVRSFEAHLERNPDLAADVRQDLAGRDLMCFCPLTDRGHVVPCHADTLLILANTPGDAR